MKALSLLWTFPTGAGYSAPSVVGHRLVYTHATDGEEVVVCLDADTGACLWRHGHPTTYRDRYNYLPGPRATPTYDAGGVMLEVQPDLTCREVYRTQAYTQNQPSRDGKPPRLLCYHLR